MFTAHHLHYSSSLLLYSEAWSALPPMFANGNPTGSGLVFGNQVNTYKWFMFFAPNGLNYLQGNVTKKSFVLFTSFNM